MPSAMLEQEAQMFGLRERAFPFSGMGSPQHRQIREFMGSETVKPSSLNRLPRSVAEVARLIRSP